MEVCKYALQVTWTAGYDQHWWRDPSRKNSYV